MADFDIESVMQAHDRLHKGDVAAAHELLHKALGVENEAPDTAPLAHRLGFDAAFRTACRKNGVRAAYVLIDSHSEKGARIIAGGDAALCALLNRMLPGAQP